MAFKTVIVCSANVCRSPTAESLLASMLPDELQHVVSVESAGVHAEPGQRPCPKAVEWVSHHVRGVQAPSPEHRSRALAEATLKRADLVLAADPRCRGEVLRKSPSARPHLFTLVEASMLAEAVLRVADGSRADPRTGLRLAPMTGRSSTARLHWLVEEMNAARGLVPITRNGQSAPEAVDAHGARAVPHDRTLSLVISSMKSLSESMRSVTER